MGRREVDGLPLIRLDTESTAAQMELHPARRRSGTLGLCGYHQCEKGSTLHEFMLHPIETLAASYSSKKVRLR
jgi:hypothetical protein